MDRSTPSAGRYFPSVAARYLYLLRLGNVSNRRHNAEILQIDILALSRSLAAKRMWTYSPVTLALPSSPRTGKVVWRN